MFQATAGPDSWVEESLLAWTGSPDVHLQQLPLPVSRACVADESEHLPQAGGEAQWEKTERKSVESAMFPGILPARSS